MTDVVACDIMRLPCGASGTFNFDYDGVRHNHHQGERSEPRRAQGDQRRDAALEAHLHAQDCSTGRQLRDEGVEFLYSDVGGAACEDDSKDIGRDAIKRKFCNAAKLGNHMDLFNTTSERLHLSNFTSERSHLYNSTSERLHLYNATSER